MEALMLIRPFTEADVDAGADFYDQLPESAFPPLVLIYGLARDGRFVQKTVLPQDRETATSIISGHTRANPACTYIDADSRQWTIVTVPVRFWEACVGETQPSSEIVDKTASVVRTIRRQMKEAKKRREESDFDFDEEQLNRLCLPV